MSTSVYLPLPTIAIVGRPNVGKSTLFNALTRTRDALVADQPGLTRDRQTGRGQTGEHPYWIVDTGGLSHIEDTPLNTLVAQQVNLALQEADSVLFLVDGRTGLTAEDEIIANQLRILAKPVHVVVNKTEGLNGAIVSADFYSLGFASIHTISAAHRRGIEPLMEAVLSTIQPISDSTLSTTSEEEEIKVAVIGRPNVGKSTLINRLLGYERVITCDMPGTTRDSIYIPFERDGQRYILIDTAGVRRRARVTEVIEKFSIIKTLQAIDTAHVVVMLLDAREGITDQDANLIGSVLDSGRALVLAINKWDGLSHEQKEQVRTGLSFKLHFIDFAIPHMISALHGTGVGQLFGAINQAYHSAQRHISTSQLNEVLQRAVEAHQPPLILGRRIKLRYAHQGGHNPPLFIIHGNQVTQLPDAYRRYLINTFRTAFDLQGTPIRLEFKQGNNPFEGRKNTLTPRQTRKRQRLLKHVKK